MADNPPSVYHPRMDAQIDVDSLGAAVLTVFSEEAARWFATNYQGSFLTNAQIAEGHPLRVTGITPYDLYEEFISAGFKVEIRRATYW